MKLLLLHGALGSATQMHPLTEMLSMECICPDLPGHGQMADTCESFDVVSIAAHLAEGITAPMDIFGYSMGGYVALLLAATYPEKVRKVITLATKFDWTLDGAAKEVTMLNADKIREKVPAFALALEQRHGEHWPAVMQRTASMMLALGQAPALTSRQLQMIEVPVLLMRGELDSMVGETETLWAASHIAHSEIHTLKGQPHPLEKTDLNVVAAEMTRFLSTV
jgi:pimeloyl-ACP methyl ester carboxylesterase